MSPFVKFHDFKKGGPEKTNIILKKNLNYRNIHMIFKYLHFFFVLH